MHGEWVRKPENGASVVFVHGILSSGESCWRHDDGVYWPELLKNEPGLEAWGIYVYTYATGIFSGTYSLNDVVDDLKERFLNLDKVANAGALSSSATTWAELSSGNSWSSVSATCSIGRSRSDFF
ncbi:MAG: hypothetical protein ACRERU_00185 [Methylococcales bacterium]